MKKILLIYITCNFILIACQQDQSSDSVRTEEVHQDAKIHDHQVEAVGGLALNNGSKWVINEEMKPIIQKSNDVLANQENFKKNGNYKELAVVLDELNTQLINSCTMKGPDHDMLHHWLEPHMKLIESLKNADTPDAESELISKLKESFQTFNQYFN